MSLIKEEKERIKERKAVTEKVKVGGSICGLFLVEEKDVEDRKEKENRKENQRARKEEESPKVKAKVKITKVRVTEKNLVLSVGALVNHVNHVYHDWYGNEVVFNDTSNDQVPQVPGSCSGNAGRSVQPVQQSNSSSSTHKFLLPTSRHQFILVQLLVL